MASTLETWGCAYQERSVCILFWRKILIQTFHYVNILFLPPIFCIVIEIKVQIFPGHPNAFSPSFSYIIEPGKNKRKHDPLQKHSLLITFKREICACNVSFHLANCSSYLLLLLSSIKDELSRVIISLHWAAGLCKTEHKLESCS